MSKITIFIPPLPQKSYAYRRGDAQIIHDDEKNAIVIDGGEDALCNEIIKYCKSHGITHITYILSHWHYDHDRGMKLLLDSSIIVDKIYCPPPADLTKLRDSDARDDYSRASQRIAQAKNLKKTIIYPPADQNTRIKVGTIICDIWRRSVRPSENVDYQVNNTSLVCYFPDLYYMTSGDTINAINTYLANKYGTIRVFKVPHHGNACTTEATNRLAELGAKLCWYNHAEAYGVGIGGDSFSHWGALYCKNKGFVCLRPFYTITMTAAEGKLYIDQNGSKWTYDIPYNGKPSASGWLKGTKGMWYQYPDGTWPTGWAWLKRDNKYYWFYFDYEGYAVTGWQYLKWSKGKSWFFFNFVYGFMLTGWQTLPWGDGKKDEFYLDPTNGNVLYGWQWLEKSGKKSWFYLDDKNGNMHKGWVFVDKSWYFLDDKDGRMHTGWLNRQGLFYLEPVSGKNQGHAYRNQTAVIDGKTWSFDDNCYAKLVSDGGNTGGGNITSVSGKLNDISASRKQFVIDIANYVRKYAPQYGINVYSPIIAQAIHESGWGESKLSAKYHNYFGLKCGTKWTGKSVNMKTQEEYSAGSLTTISANFRAYDSMEEGVKGYFEFIQLARYANLKGITSPRKYLEAIIADGYATGKQYVDHVMNLINLYNLTQFDVAVAPVTTPTEPKKTDSNPVDVLLQIASAEVGYHEGANNKNKYGDELHKIQPRNMDTNAAWCDAFCDWTVLKMCEAFGYGADMAREVLCGDFDDYTYASINLYKRQGRWASSPARGYQIFFGGSGHTGWVESVDSKINTIEGNKSDQVMRCTYALNDSRIIGYGMPKYELLSGGLTAENMPLIKKGATGFAVVELQKRLNAIPYNGKTTLTVDGDFGTKTYNAVKAYQSDRGLTPVDGEVGKITWKSLFSEV